MERAENNMGNHPSSKELSDALLRPDDARAVSTHIEQCLACRVRLARIARAHDVQPPGSNTIQTILEASTVVAGALGLPTLFDEQEPQAGELWRVGREEALLAWVRRNFEDGAIDVIPVVLDIELADEQTVMIPAAQSPLPVELAAMVALRTHVHRDAFINKLGDLDISDQVEDVIAATRQGRESLTTVGPVIVHDDDDRLEFRQALRDLLADLSPSAWLYVHGPADAGFGEPKSDALLLSEANQADVEAEISDRLWSARCMPLGHERFPFGSGHELEALFKVVYLDTAVIVAEVASLDTAMADVVDLVHACQRAAAAYPDVDAVCVAEPVEGWPCLLFSRASMREALELPAGIHVGPGPVISGLGLVDTLWKHLEGAAPAWEITERPPRSVDFASVAMVVRHHVDGSIAAIEAQGRRAHQKSKRQGWTTLPAGLGDEVARFVTAVAQSVPIEEAFAELDRESRHD